MVVHSARARPLPRAARPDESARRHARSDRRGPDRDGTLSTGAGEPRNCALWGRAGAPLLSEMEMHGVLTGNRKDPPLTRHAFQFGHSSVLELEPRASY